MFDEIEAKAQQAKDGSANSVRLLVDEIFSTLISSYLPDDMSQAMKDRLVRAELKFRHGKKGVGEARIVKTINDLADQLGAPEYAKTSPLQVHTLRTIFARRTPSLVAPETDETNRGLKKKEGSRLNPKVSPVEAVFLTILMIHQKILNPEWQQTPEEFAANLPHKRQESTASKGSHILQPSTKRREKSREMMSLMAQRVGRLSPASIQEIAATSLDNLGFER
jgi:hypothetical protein